MKQQTCYYTLKETSHSFFKEKGSKFYGYAFPVYKEEEVKACLEQVRIKHKDARHHCYAYRLGIGTEERYRANDDGEPTNSAGKPIYGQLLSANITNVLLVIVRYFGGIKLGVGGLISAYKICAKETIEAGIIIEKEEYHYYHLLFSYPEMNAIMSLIKQINLEVINQVFEHSCIIEFRASIHESESIVERLKAVDNVKVMFIAKK